ncbi:hypothetical protein ACFV9E_08730 [Streptomyces sp. NPDC059835]|uniref:hypothetical protein n=1 Tax=Streptomyces sp. NPDC059835 TaxID=3346967 RepID=UPI00365DC2AD
MGRARRRPRLRRQLRRLADQGLALDERSSLARLGEEEAAAEAQDQAHAELPASLPRFTTHLELHKGLMLARSGDRAGVAHATAAMDAPPPEKHSLTLRMLVNETRRASDSFLTRWARPCPGGGTSWWRRVSAR